VPRFRRTSSYVCVFHGEPSGATVFRATPCLGARAGTKLQMIAVDTLDGSARRAFTRRCGLNRREIGYRR